MSIPLTWLYVPGDRADRIDKAAASRPDVVIVDLEDAVAPRHKAEARAHAERGLQRAVAGGRSVQLRVNADGTPWVTDDLALVRRLPEQVGVRLPKAADPARVRTVAAAVPGHALHLLIESALGVERAYDLASASPAVATVGLGEADLRADLGVTSDEGLAYARGRLVAAAAAAGLPPPAMSVYAHVRDLEGLRESCSVGRSLGFLGRAAIHPGQLDVIRAVFTPTPDEVRAAQQLVDVAERGDPTARGSVALPDGRFVDEAVLRQARRVLDLGASR